MERPRRALARLQSAVKTMKGALVYQGMPLCEALMQAAKTAYGSFCKMCPPAAAESGRTGKEICQKALTEEKEAALFFGGLRRSAGGPVFAHFHCGLWRTDRRMPALCL